jgi:hypothetical protein
LGASASGSVSFPLRALSRLSVVLILLLLLILIIVIVIVIVIFKLSLAVQLRAVLLQSVLFRADNHDSFTNSKIEASFKNTRFLGLTYIET